MTEQQMHLQQLVERRNQLIAEIQSLNSNATSSRELLLRVEGAIEYLQQVGVTLPEPEITEEVESFDELNAEQE